MLNLGDELSKLMYSNILWRVKRERAPIAINRLGCTTYENIGCIYVIYENIGCTTCGYFHASFPHRHWMKQELRHTSPFLKAVVGRGLLTSSRAASGSPVVACQMGARSDCD